VKETGSESENENSQYLEKKTKFNDGYFDDQINKHAFSGCSKFSIGDTTHSHTNQRLVLQNRSTLITFSDRPVTY